MKLLHTLDRWWRTLRGRPVDEHEQQLMRLYWNRAELKKELTELQDERHALLAKLTTYQDAVQRAGEQVDELAAYLGRPEVGTQALCYFQLRSLWRSYSDKLTRFVGDLRAQQEERERRRHTADIEAQRAGQLAELRERLLNAQSVADSLAARYGLLEKKLNALRRLWHHWKRRDVRLELTQVRAQWEVASLNVTELVDEQSTLQAAPLEAYPGLSRDGRRIVNTAAIAYAEWLIVNLPLRTLAPLSRHAIGVQIFDAQLGTQQECVRCMESLRMALGRVDELDKQLSTLREPTERVRSRARYKSEEDTVPLADSIGDVQIAPADAQNAKVTANVLADDYWSISQVLIH